MKKIISILLITSLLTTCNANEQSRLSKWKSNTTNFIKENKKKTIAFCVAVVAISGSGYFLYKTKKQNSEERDLAKTIIHDVFNKVLSKRDEITKAQEALNAAEEWLEEARNNDEYTRGIEILVASAKRFLQKAIEENTDRMYEKPEELTANYQFSEKEKEENINRIARKEFSEATVNDIINNVLSNKEQKAHQEKIETIKIQQDEITVTTKTDANELSDTEFEIFAKEFVVEKPCNISLLNLDKRIKRRIINLGYRTVKELDETILNDASIFCDKMYYATDGAHIKRIKKAIDDYLQMIETFSEQ